MIGSYKVEGDKIIVNTPYCISVVEQCRKWAGRFEKGKGWIVPVSRLAEVQEQLGTDCTDQVEVEVGKSDWTGYEQIHVGWYVLAGRRGRDHAADVYADLVAGEIPSWGGSMKNPCVKPSDDARFRLWVPRDFAIARGLTIITETAPTQVPAVVDPLTAAVESGLARINGEGTAKVDAKAIALVEIRKCAALPTVEYSWYAVDRIMKGDRQFRS
jgi:hypothetical protein